MKIRKGKFGITERQCPYKESLVKSTAGTNSRVRRSDFLPLPARRTSCCFSVDPFYRVKQTRGDI